MKIGIIGAGISGIVAAHMLGKYGHEVVVFEKSTELGGVWALGYPGVRLQNTGPQYRISDIPWQKTADRHPTSGQIREYLNTAVASLNLDIRGGHEVTDMREDERGWILQFNNAEGRHEATFDFVVVAIGQYTEGKHKPDFPGQDEFKGEIITERDVHDLDVFNGKCVTVVGFGKSAIDMVCFAVERANKVNHLFRTPRWLMPCYTFGIHYSRLMFARMTTALMPSWAHGSRIERLLHGKLNFLVRAAWQLVTTGIRMQCKWHGRGKSRETKKGTCRSPAGSLHRWRFTFRNGAGAGKLLSIYR